MATSDWGVNSPEAVKVWSRELAYEALKATYMARFMGDGSDAVIQLKDDLAKGPGDRITTILRMQLTGNGRTGDNTLEGYEEALVTYTDNLLIDQLRNAVRSGGKMSEQRVPFSVRAEAKDALRDWWAGKFDSWFFNQIAGDASNTDVSQTGNNATVSPTGSIQVFAGAATDEDGLSSGASTSRSFSLEVIDKAVIKARTVSPVIRPLSGGLEADGKARYVMFITPEQHYDLRRNTATLEWADIQKFAQSRGDDNPIFTGALGMYNGVVLHEAFRLPRFSATGETANRVHRAVLCGAQACTMGFGRGYGSKQRFSWAEEMFDYGNQLGVSAGCIAGLKKNVFNSRDFAVIAASTTVSAAAAAASGR